MIIAIGLDIVEITRIQHSLKTYKGRFRDKYFTESERQYCSSHSNPSQHYAARFAAKEAFFKAFGGPWPKGCGHVDVEVVIDEKGKPSINIADSLLVEMKKLGVSNIHLSITHSRKTAAAVVLLEK